MGPDGSLPFGPFVCLILLLLPINPMRPYPLPKDLTREFNRLVTTLYQLLSTNGLDPANHLTVGDFSDTVKGSARTRFALYLSFSATELFLKLNSQ